MHNKSLASGVPDGVSEIDLSLWNYICHHIWNQQRLQAAHRAGICTVQEIFHELRSLKQFVICPADHHPYRAHLCCSRHFHFLLIKRFMAEIFTRCSVGWNTVFPRLIQDLQIALPPHSRKLVSSNAKCPYAYILPKPSKFFESARPIISYTDSWNCRLGQVVGGMFFNFAARCFTIYHWTKTSFKSWKQFIQFLQICQVKSQFGLTSKIFQVFSILSHIPE